MRDRGPVAVTAVAIELLDPCLIEPLAPRFAADVTT